MTLPASIRVNVGVPFPARVQGSGPITVTKQNGIWTVGFSFTGIATQVPAPVNYPTDLILFYDSVAKSFFTMSISTLVAALTPPAATRLQRSVVASPIVIAGNDSIINFNIVGAATCALPASATRNGAPLTFKSINAAAPNLVITPNGVQTIDGAANLTMNIAKGETTLVPFNDGVNTGWYIG